MRLSARVPFSTCLPFSARVVQCLALIAGCLFLSAREAAAQGNLLVTPRRVLFEGNKRTQELNLANIGSDTARYMVSLIEIEMQEDGSFKTIKDTDTGRNFASPYLRFFPRNVVLAPNEAQTLRVQLVNTAKLAPGEYRSHLYFRGVPRQTPLGDSTTNDSGAISVSIVPVFGISIPVIVRVGETSVATAISDVSLDLKEKEATLKMTFNRTGNISVYGNLTVTHIAPDGKVTPAGIVKGLAVYTPNPKRRFSMTLDASLGINYHSGKLHLVYTDANATNTVLAETEIILN